MFRYLKTLLLLFILFNFVLIYHSVFAQSIDPIKDYLNVEQCGLLNKKCCPDMSVPPIHISDNIKGAAPPFDTFFSAASALINTVLDQTINPIANGVKDLYLSPQGQDKRCIEGKPSDNDINKCVCLDEKNESLGRLCLMTNNNNEKNNCQNCIKNGEGLWTSLGCLKTDMTLFIKETVFGIGIGLAGTISLLCIIYAAFMMQSSQGNPEKLKKAQELLTSCIMGLMLIIFSVFILRLIGVDILRIPGFS